MDEQHYIIVEGTNLRRASKGLNAGTIAIYDTCEIAQKQIDHDVKGRVEMDKLLRKPPLQRRTFVPISVAEYNRKYPPTTEEE